MQGGFLYPKEIKKMIRKNMFYSLMVDEKQAVIIGVCETLDEAKKICIDFFNREKEFAIQEIPSLYIEATNEWIPDENAILSPMQENSFDYVFDVEEQE